MESEREKGAIFDICLGGIFSKETPSAVGEVNFPNTYETRRDFRNFLMSAENVGKVFAIEEDKAEGTMKFYGPFGVGREERGDNMLTCYWEIPVIFKMDVKKGFVYEGCNGQREVIGSALKAVVLYDGIWFMAVYDPNQCGDVGEAFWLGSRIRDILVDLMNRGGKFIPQVVPPCLMPVDISLKIISTVAKGRDVSVPKYHSTETRYYSAEKSRSRLTDLRGGSSLLIKYENKRDEVLDDDVAMIMWDIYSNIGRSMESYYCLEGLSDWHMKKRDEMLEEYRRTCADVEEYLKISNWNLAKKSIMSNRLGRKTTMLQMKLVNNSLRDKKMMRDSLEIDMYQDKMGIMNYIREDLKDSIRRPYEETREEYEAFMSIISEIDKITSQHNFVLLSIIAVVAGLIGAIIGSVVG